MNGYPKRVRNQILALHEQGMAINEIARRLKGLIDRDTVKRWVKEHKDSKNS
jgi:transposase-like protein